MQNKKKHPVYSSLSLSPRLTERVPTHLGRSRSGRSRGWSPRCPCVSSPPPPGRPGPWRRCLPAAAPAGVGGASARAPETPAGTGSSCLSLQVSGMTKTERRLIKLHGRSGRIYAKTVHNTHTQKRRYREDKPQLISELSDLLGVFVVNHLVCKTATAQ